MQTLEGKTAIVTGASAPSGIGRATALELSREGARVVVTDIAGRAADGTAEKLDLLQALAEQIRNDGGEALALEVDVTKGADVAVCMARTVEAFGGLDILVNNAASLVGTGAFIDSRPEDWTLSYEVNLLGVVLMCQAAIPLLRARGGSIINIGSSGSLGAEPGFGAYTTMKHGLIGLTKTIASEHGVDGIRCNAVCPGYTETDMHMAVNERLSREQGLAMEEVKAQRYAAVALRRAGRPEEVAKAIAYLAGPASGYVTGVALPVSGGVPCGI